MTDETITSIDERQAEDKRKMIDALKEMPIVQYACKKTGVSRATYYRFRQDDKAFKRESADAVEQGIEYINDMSESQLVTLIKERKMPAIALWLKSNHPRYGSKTRSHVPIATADDLLPEEERIVIEALRLASGGDV